MSRRAGRGPDIEQLRAWTYHRQGLAAAHSDALAALRGTAGVYSSHPTAPLALLARTKTLDPREFGALDRERLGVRMPTMRRSVFLVPADNAERVFAATRVPVETFTGNLKYQGLGLDDYERLKPAVLEAVRDPATIDAVRGSLGDPAGLKTVINLMAYEGLVLRLGGTLRTDRLEFVATDSWLGEPLDDIDPAAALAWLGGEYLRAFGPARVADFAWWAGVTKTRAAAAFATLDTLDLGEGLMLRADDEAPFVGAERVDRDTIDLLPKWDSYTMGYPADGRARLVNPEHLSSAFTRPGSGYGATAGDGLPLVLAGGRAVASWSHRFEGTRMAAAVNPFPGEATPPGIEPALARAARLLGATDLAVTAS